MSTIPFANFTKGELAPELQARIDTNQYLAAAKRVRNFIIQRYGGLSFRPGFRLVAEVDDVTKNTRYFPFQYNMEQAYVMALEDERMRLLAGGGVIIEENVKITAITKAANAQITMAYHGYEVGDRIFFYGITGMTELNGQSGIVISVQDANNFTVNINTTGYTTFISSDGIDRSGPKPAPPTPEPPPPPPPPPPEPPPTATDGGNGTATGDYDGWQIDYGNYSELEQY
jgi:hypothetical protein